MSKIEVEGSIGAVETIEYIVGKMQTMSLDGKARVIRIGGDERWFDGSRDSCFDIQGDCDVISFSCNPSSYPTVIGILKQLQSVCANGTSRVIRIGGEEEVFEGSRESIYSITVDGVADNDSYVPCGKLNTTTPYTPCIKLNVNKSATPTSATPAIPKITRKNTTNLSDDKVITIQEAVMEMIGNGEMFTAFDITKEVRADGMRVFHNEVRQVIEDMLSDIVNCGYTRTPITLSVGKVARVYHTVSSNADDYQNIGHNQPV